MDIQSKPLKWLNSGDQQQIFSLIPDAHKPIIAFLMLHGCRPAEARALKVKGVDLSNRTITISATFSLRTYREKRKGKHSKTATIPIHPEMYDFLAGRVKGNFPESFIFINPNTGTYYSDSALLRVWDSVRTVSGLPKSFRLYDATRHSLASQLVNSGTTLFAISRLLGHSSNTVHLGV